MTNSIITDKVGGIRAKGQVLSRSMVNGMKVVAPGLFMRELLNRPGAVGAVWPSSGKLARRMAADVPRFGSGLVVELGGGTGVVTNALLEHGIAAGRLVVVERSAAFVHHLRQRFPSVNVLQGDAKLLADLLPAGEPIDAIVSSLPLRSLSPDDAAAIVGQWHRILRPESILVQFTYDLRGVLGHVLGGFAARANHLVWANLPPARVLVFECCHCS